MSFSEVVVSQIRSWDRFYSKIEADETEPGIAVRAVDTAYCDSFIRRWTSSRPNSEIFESLESLWVYPNFRNDSPPNLVLNFAPVVSARSLEATLKVLLNMFRGLTFTLLLGTERSMLGRLEYLARVSLLEPWLFKAAGRCLYGNAEVRYRIREPSISELKTKLRESFLYFSYRVFPRAEIHPSYYTLAFKLDHLMQKRELVIRDEDLQEIYGRDAFAVSGSAGSAGNEKIRQAWKDLHGLDLFAT
jgi:hypothetical protein